MGMTEDERQIRALVARWHEASRAGDVSAVLELMTDDVVFLTEGRPPMSMADFAAAAPSANAGDGGRPVLEARQTIHEVRASGDVAFMWSDLEVTMTPPGATEPVVRSGHTLTVFFKVGGRWKLARDANLLTVKPKDAAKHVD
jgi:uncharacterized protein (TIGR02246 family)